VKKGFRKMGKKKTQKSCFSWCEKKKKNSQKHLTHLH